MQQYPSEVSLSGSLHFLVPPNPSLFSDHFSNMMSINSISTTPNYNNNFIDNHVLYNNNFQCPSDQLQNISTYNNNQYLGSCMSNNSTSDEAEEAAGGQLSLINERKQRRMISNRESAHRSRMRKKKHLDELWSQVVWLRSENHHLMDKLIHASDCLDEVVRENSTLKEEAAKLREMFSDLSNPIIGVFDNDIVDIYNTAYPRAESSSIHSI